MSELTIREHRFCEAFVELGNASQAYQQAIARTGAAPVTANGAYYTSQKWLARPEIFIRITELRAAEETRTRIDRETLVDELAGIAFRDGIDSYLDYDETSVTLKPLSELTPRQARAIKSVRVDPKTGFPRIEFESRIDAIQQLGRILGYYQNNMKIDVTKRFVVEAPATITDSAAWERLAAHTLDLPAQRLDPPQPDDEPSTT